MPELAREELYNLVWSVPILKLAEQFGMSDRGLGKICERQRIPTPPRGYWAKLMAGIAVKKTPLPEMKLEVKTSPKDIAPVNARKKRAASLRARLVRNETAVVETKSPSRLNLEAAVDRTTETRSPTPSEDREETRADFPPASLDGMISHDELLERYSWLSGQILNRWRRKGLIRSFRGKAAVLYSRQELDHALEAEMRIDEPPEPRQRPIPEPSQRDQLIYDLYHEERFLRGMSKTGILEQKDVERLNRQRQEVGLGPIATEPREPPQPKRRAQKNRPRRAGGSG